MADEWLPRSRTDAPRIHLRRDAELAYNNLRTLVKPGDRDDLFDRSPQCLGSYRQILSNNSARVKHKNAASPKKWQA